MENGQKTVLMYKQQSKDMYLKINSSTLHVSMMIFYILAADAHHEVGVGEQSWVFTECFMGDKISIECFVTDPCILMVKGATQGHSNLWH